MKKEEKQIQNYKTRKITKKFKNEKTKYKNTKFSKTNTKFKNPKIKEKNFKMGHFSPPPADRVDVPAGLNSQEICLQIN